MHASRCLEVVQFTVDTVLHRQANHHIDSTVISLIIDLQIDPVKLCQLYTKDSAVSFRRLENGT